MVDVSRGAKFLGRNTGRSSLGVVSSSCDFTTNGGSAFAFGQAEPVARIVFDDGFDAVELLLRWLHEFHA